MTTLTPPEADLLQRIARRDDALRADLRLHVELPTGGPSHPATHRALDQTRALFADRLAALGATVETVPGAPKPDWLFGVTPDAHVPPTLVARRPARDPRRAPRPIVLSGHLDTVHDPDGPFRHLTLAPDGKTATGPGCVDMKGGLVILLAALEALDQAGIDADWTVILNSDEETGSYHSEAALRAEARRALSRHPAAVGLVVEPALPDGSLVIERLGSGQFMIEAQGRAAHVGRDFEKGVSAVAALAKAVVAAANLSDPATGRIVNLGPLQGGIATNVVPDLARAWGNARFPTKAVAADIEARLRALEQGDPAHPPHILARTSFNRPAKPLTPAVQALADLARQTAQTLNQPLPFGKTGGVCDGNILQDEGLPCLDTLGVRGGGLHTPQEWIDLSSLVERCQLLALFIARLAPGPA